MKISKELIQLLMEIAMLNYDKGCLNEAEEIFESISKIKPESGSPSIGKACIEMHKGHLEKAISILRNAPYQNYIQEELCECYLGKALKIAGYNTEANEILTHLTEYGNFDVAVDLARELLSADLTSK